MTAPEQRTLPVLLTSAALLGVALYLVGVATDAWLLRMCTKPLPVLALIGWTLWKAPGPVGRWVAAALALGLGGDVLLEIGSQTFLFGLVSFLVGHLAYIVGFSKGARWLAPVQLVPMLGFAAAVAAVIVPALGEMAVPVVVYMVVICLMAWRAAAYAESRGGWAWACLGGAVLFLFSDTLIALDRFVAPIDGVRPAIILTYWLGQAGLALGAVGAEAARQRGAPARR